MLGDAPKHDSENQRAKKKKKAREKGNEMKPDHGELRDEENNALAIAIRRGQAKTRSDRTPSPQTLAAESCGTAG